MNEIRQYLNQVYRKDENDIAENKRFNVKDAYDESVKKILMERAILARVLKSCLNEYSDCNVDEIKENIEVNPKLPFIDEEFNKYYQNHKEEKPLEIAFFEQTDLFDFFFTAVNPLMHEKTYFTFNIDEYEDSKQKDSFVERGFLYCSSMISSQKGREFVGEDCGNLKSVCNICICVNHKEKSNGSVRVYRSKILQKSQSDETWNCVEEADLMRVVIINVGKYNPS